MSKNFRKTAVLKKIWIVTYIFTPNDSSEKIRGRYMQLYALQPLLKIFYTFACKRFPGKNCRQICGKSEARVCGTRLPTRQHGVEKRDKTYLLRQDFELGSSSPSFTNKHILKCWRPKSTSKSSRFTGVLKLYLNLFSKVKRIRAPKWAFSFKILVRIASYGLQIDQSHCQNRLSHIIN